MSIRRGRKLNDYILKLELLDSNEKGERIHIEERTAEETVIYE
jgi:hypothetical protein